MTDRVVLGSGSFAHSVLTTLMDRSGSLRVLTEDEDRAGTLRERGIAVEFADPTDQVTLARLDPPPDVVVVAGADPDQNLAAARTADQVFHDAFVLGYTAGGDPDAMAAYVDHVVDPGQETLSAVMDRAGDRGLRLHQLRRTMRHIDQLAIVTHDNPDPDAIASAVALQQIATASGCDAEVVYFGDITHQENRAFVNLLEFDLVGLEPDATLDEFDGIALVDHSRPGVNDQLPPETSVDIVIDHHPPREPIEAAYVDLRSNVGATSTLLVEYLKGYNLSWGTDVATGLLFGIRVDTREFTREVSSADFEAAATVLPHADLGLLERIESPSVSPETFRTIADAIANRRREGSVLLSCVGELTNRDALAQAADRLLELEDIVATVVYGVADGTIYISARSRGTDVDLGETLREAFGQIGSAGGHADMAGAQIELGVLGAVDDRDESLRSIVEGVVADRFIDALEGRTAQSVTGVFAPGGPIDPDYVADDEELSGADGDSN